MLLSGLAVLLAVGVIVALNLKQTSAGGPAGSAGSVGPLPLGLVRPATEIRATAPRTGRTLGSPAAKVVLNEWEDFQCPACSFYSTTIEPEIISRFVQPGGLRIAFHDFAFLGRESTDAAVAARCADGQGKFWDYHQWLYANQQGENQGWFSTERLAAIADQVGLDRTTWDACVADGSQVAVVAAEKAAGAAAGVSGTPTLMIDGRILAFKTPAELLQQIQAAIDAAGGLPSAVPAASGSSAPAGSSAP